MILQALNSYYERVAADAESGMPPFGTSIEKISFALIIDNSGVLKGVDDLREQSGKKLLPRKIPVPAAVTRTSGVKANFLWDKAAYVFGADGDGPTDDNKSRFESFQALLQEVCQGIEDNAVNSVLAFLQQWDRMEAKSVLAQYHPWDDLCNANFVFRLDGVPGYVHERNLVREAWLKYIQQSNSAPHIQCMVNGEKNVPQARVHTPIKGVRGGQTSGGYIVSYNATAFVSYGQDKAAVSEMSAFAYTTALNALLSSNSRQHIVIGDMTLVFWAEKPSPAEDIFADLFDPPEIETKTSKENRDDQETAEKIRGLLHAVKDGRRVTDIIPDLDDSVRFYIIGLSPNAARLSIRFWEVDNFGNLLKRISKYFDQLSIARQFEDEPEYPPLWRLLCQTAALGKSENVSPILAGNMARAILTGSRFPQNLLPLVLQRIHSEHNITYFRAAMLKAYLIRNATETNLKEVTMTLDVERTDGSYLLGRLFSVLEKAQEEAIPGANATMKDRYLSSASATPGLVFHMILKNSTNHIAKLRKDPEKTGRAMYFEKLIQEIVDKFDAFPSTLPAEEQGLFMIGYYHQRKNFFTKKIEEN